MAVLSETRRARPLLTFLALLLLLPASLAATPQIGRANRSRGHGASRQRSQAQAQQRAEAQARQRQEAQARQRQQAQSRQRQQQVQAQARQRQQAQARQRQQAQAQKRAQSQGRQRGDAQGKARPRQQAQPDEGNRQPARSRPDPQQQSERFKNSLRQSDGVRPNNHPDRRPRNDPAADPDGGRWQGAGERPAARPGSADRLQGDHQRPGAVRKKASASGQEGAPDWDSASGRFEDSLSDEPGRWQQIRNEVASRHPDSSDSSDPGDPGDPGDQTGAIWGEAGQLESSAEWSSGGFIVGGGGYYGGNSNWWEDDAGWEDDTSGYAPSNNEFYEADAQAAEDARTASTAADPGRTDPAAAGDANPGETPVTPPAPLPGTRILKLSPDAVEADTVGERLLYDRGVFYRDHQVGKRYEVVQAPMGAIVPTLPPGAREVTLDGDSFSVWNEVYYKKVYKGGGVAYMVSQVGSK